MNNSGYTEQITSMISVFDLNGNDVTLVIPIKVDNKQQTVQHLADYYAVEKSFNPLRSPSIFCENQSKVIRTFQEPGLR